jgi:hypothetical protein
MNQEKFFNSLKTKEVKSEKELIEDIKRDNAKIKKLRDIVHDANLSPEEKIKMVREILPRPERKE